MKLLLLITSVATIIGCSKRSGVNESCDEYYIASLQDKWKVTPDCGNGCSHSLGKGIYKSSVIYFTDVHCINWNTAPKTSGVGVKCNGDSIKVDNWSEIEDIQIIATCPGE